MIVQMEPMALSAWQTLNRQGVINMARKARLHPKVVNENIARVGTWNVRTSFRAGKLDNRIREKQRFKVNVLGLNEVRLSGS